ncbi:hypothetical protein ABBQ32_002790 [Trebouxia sp. C0010 RCD-2024]
MEGSGLSQEELVAMLRSRARKNGAHASVYNGVSLIRQTGKWHAHIDIEGTQVHLGYFLSEQIAAKAYDRAAIIKGTSGGQAVATNFDINSYTTELEVLQALDQDAFVAALDDEKPHKGLLDMLGQGFTVQGARAVFGPSFLQPSTKPFAAQARAPKTQRQVRALHTEASGPPSASTSKVSTRKRKLAHSPSAAATAATAAAAISTAINATAASAAAQASTAAVHSEQSLGVSDATPAEASHAAAQAPIAAQKASRDASKTKRRSSRTLAGKSHQAQAAAPAAAAAVSAGSHQQSVEQPARDSNKLTVADGIELAYPQLSDSANDRPVAAIPVAAARSLASQGARREADRLQTLAEAHTAQASNEQVAASSAAALASSGGRRTRASSVGLGDTKTLITSEAATGSVQQGGADQGKAGNSIGHHAASERHKRLSARRQRTEPKASSSLSQGTAAPSYDTPDSQQPSAPAAAQAPGMNAAAADAQAETPQFKPATRVTEATPGIGHAKTVTGVVTGSGGQTRRQQKTAAAAATQTAQHQEGSPAKTLAAEGGEDLTAMQALGAAPLTRGAAPSKTRGVNAAAALGVTDASTGMPGTMATASQFSDALTNGQSHGTGPAGTKAAADPAVHMGSVLLATQTAAAGPNAPHPTQQSNAPHASADGLLHASCPPAPAFGSAPHGPGRTALSPPPAGNHLDPLTTTGVAPAQATVANALPMAESMAAAQHTSISHAQHGGSAGATLVEGVNSRGADPYPKQQGPGGMMAAISALEEAPAAAEASSDLGVPDQAGVSQDNPPCGAQPDPLDTPPASPTAAPTAPTPLTAQGAAATAERPSVDASQHAGTGQALFQPLPLDTSPSHPATSPMPEPLSGPPVPIPAGSTVVLDAGDSKQGLRHGQGTASASAVVPSQARFSDLKTSSGPQQAPGGGEATGVHSGSGAFKSASASTAIAAAERANAAAANAIAESGALANSNRPGAPGQFVGPRVGGACGTGVRTFTVSANPPLAQRPSGRLITPATASHMHPNGALSNSYAGTSANGPVLSGGRHSAARPGPLAAGQGSVMSPASHTASIMTQQQRLNGTAFMTAMQQSNPMSSIQGTYSRTSAVSAGQAAAGLPNPIHNLAGLGQQPAASLTSGPGPRSQSFPNPRLRLSGPVPFEASSNNPSFGGATVKPSFAPFSSSIANPGTSGNPPASGAFYSALGLSNSSPSPIVTQLAGPKAAGPAYEPQGLRAAALESSNQIISSAAASQDSWGPSTAPLQGGPTPPQSQASLPAGAQATPVAANPQPAPQLPLPASLAPQPGLPAAQSCGMTNAHAIVPGMPPSSVSRASNTAWQVGLAAGLAATANLRPPNPSLGPGHQAATTAAAARAAAAFQASRALSMARSHSQQSPLLQQGSAAGGVSGSAAAAHGTNLAGPSTLPSSEPTAPAPSTATTASNRPLITSGSGGADGWLASQADSAATAVTGSTATAFSAATAANGHTGIQSGGSLPVTSHQAFARQAVPPAASAVATALPGRPPNATAMAGQLMMPPSAYSAEAQALYRARAQQQPLGAQTRPYLAQSQPGVPLQPSYVSLSQPPYNVQTHTPYIAPSQVPYVAPSQSMYKPPPSQATYGGLAMYPAAAAGQAQSATAAQRYPAALAQPQPPLLRPQLTVEHFTFAKLAPQPKNAIDIICEDAVLPAFPLKKKKLKKRKLAGFEVFAAEVAKLKLALESSSHGLQRHVSRNSPLGRPSKDFKPRVASAAQQPERWLGKASSMTSLAAKPKGRTAKGTKGKLTAAAKGTKGKKKGSKAADADTPRKKSDRVNWNAAGAGRRRSVERPSGRQFADAARLHHQEAVGTSGLEQLLGVLEDEFSDFEPNQSDSDDGQVSATEQGGPTRGSAPGRGRGVAPSKRGKPLKAASKALGTGRGRGKVKGATESAAGKVVKAKRKRAVSSSPDRGPVRSNRRKIQAPSRGS